MSSGSGDTATSRGKSKVESAFIDDSSVMGIGTSRATSKLPHAAKGVVDGDSGSNVDGDDCAQVTAMAY
jgi:hypothetical protein